MKIKKLTYGFVEQIFEDGVCTSQFFSAGDQIAYVDENGKTIRPIDVKDREELHFPFDMVQPDDDTRDEPPDDRDDDEGILRAGDPCPECGVILARVVAECETELKCAGCGLNYGEE